MNKKVDKEAEKLDLLKIVLGIAIKKYGYNPNLLRNPATGDGEKSIKFALKRIGLHVHEDTIRKYLSEASKLFPDVKLVS